MNPRTARSMSLLAFVSSLACAATEGPLPIEKGDYVRLGSPCKDAPLAAIIRYDGANVSGPHTSRCTTRVLSHDSATWRLSTRCDGLGDGTAAHDRTEIQEVVVQSRTAVTFMHAQDVADYRRCSAS